MRSLLLLPGAFGPAGGLEMYDRLIIKALSGYAAGNGGTCAVLILNDCDPDVDMRYLPSGAARPRTFGGSKWRFSLAAVRSALQMKPDLVVLGHIGFSPLALALRLLRAGSAHWFLTYGIEAWRPLGAYQRAALRSAERTISISEFTRNELVRQNELDPDRVSLLPCAIDPLWAEEFQDVAEQARTHSPERLVLLTVARLAATERYKGVEEVLRALPRIAHQVPEIRYVVVGEGDDRTRLQALARDIGVSDRVEFRGRVSLAELARAYAESSLFVMPSENEGFGIVYLEAAFFSRPSIAGIHGGAPEVVEEGVTGQLVARDDPERLVATIVSLLLDPGKRSAMGERARQRILDRFTYETFARTLEGYVSGTPQRRAGGGA